MEIARDILKHYEIEVENIEMIRHNENMTYRVEAVEGEFVLRIHKSIDTMDLSMIAGGRKQEDLLEGEMIILEQLSSKLEMQSPVKNQAGCYVTKSEGYLATMLTWAPGECLKKEQVTPEIAKEIGRTLARIHDMLRDVQGVTRYSYGMELLQSMERIYHTVIKESDIGKERLDVLEKLMRQICEVMQAKTKEEVMIHNDLGESNLLINNEKIAFIDFSISGLGIREMDLASLYCHFENSTVREAILQGYQEVAQDKIEEKTIDLCIGYQILIFVFSQFRFICNQPWFGEALNYWCSEIFSKIVAGEKIAEEIGLYS